MSSYFVANEGDSGWRVRTCGNCGDSKAIRPDGTTAHVCPPCRACFGTGEEPDPVRGGYARRRCSKCRGAK